jgi:catechol 2,3-dioxygenase-like lactoylglutathione lyase family enzyme
VKDHLLAVEHELRRHHDGQISIAATGDEVTEPVRGDERAPLGVVNGGIPLVDQHPSIIACAGQDGSVIRLATVTLVVRDYDEALRWFADVLGFAVVEDTPLTGDKRWVVVGPHDGSTRLLLAKASTAGQEERVGDQTGGRVAFFLETDDFTADHERMTRAGVTFVEAPRAEPYGRVAVFEDLYGNRWDLIGP